MKRMIFILILFILSVGFIFIIQLNKVTYPVSFGISFNQNHAKSLGLDWKETYTDMLKELQPEYIRIAAMWSEVEKEAGTFDFADVDWMMDMAKKYESKVTLVVGQKAPRWPECHVPVWLNNYSDADASKTHLFDYIDKTVERYKDHEALEIWQVENEPFIRFKFGECDNYRKDLVEEEIAFVKEKDSSHKIMVTDSGEIATWRKSSRAGDIFGTTLYRIVRTPKGKIWTYDWLPAAYYNIKARLWGRSYEDFFVAELQAEPWFTDAGAENTPVAEQEKTMNIERLEKHIEYTRHVGASRAYLWGVEWWYFMKEKQDDARYWEMVKEIASK